MRVGEWRGGGRVGAGVACVLRYTEFTDFCMTFARVEFFQHGEVPIGTYTHTAILDKKILCLAC